MLVSILIPCFNAERWVGQAIESALGQTWPEKELIVFDDGSTDRSLDIIKTFGDRLRWETGPNRGGNVARNRLLELAKGEWLQYLDADDYLLPDKISGQMDFLAVHSEADVVFGPITLEYATESNARREFSRIPEPRDPWVLLARWYLPQTGSPLWRKQAIVNVSGWKIDQPCCQEHELYLRLLMAGKRFVYCSGGGAIYRQWGEHTLCKRDTSEVHRQRLEIEQRVEDFLRAEQQLTADRLWAINQARFEVSRMAWLYDTRFAAAIIAKIRQSQPSFVPGGDAARLHYRLAYQALGFSAVQRLADWKRILFCH